MAKEKNEVIKEAEVRIGRFTAEDQAIYMEISRDIWESDRTTELNYEREEGRKEAEKRRNIEIIKEMRKKDFSTELIMEITKLTKEQVEELEKQSKNSSCNE